MFLNNKKNNLDLFENGIKYSSISKNNEDSFMIIAYTDICYAVEISDIIKIIQISTENSSDTIEVDGEKISLVFLNAKTDKKRYLDHKKHYILCKNKLDVKTAIYIGDIWDTFNVFIKTLPNLEGIITKNQISDNIYLYYHFDFNSYPIKFIKFTNNN